MSLVRPDPQDDLFFDPELSPALRAALTTALAGPYRRVERVAAGGEVAWLKRVERLSLRWRLQKGDARHALEAERLGLLCLAEHGIGVPRLLAAGPDFLATLAAGRILPDLLDTGLPSEERLRAFAAAGAALARCHAAGFVHGRPKIRDICWDGEVARFIDLERFDPTRSSPRAMVLDLLILLHSLVMASEAPRPLFDAVVTAWRQAAPEAALACFATVRRRLWLLVLVARWVQRLRPHSRELAAVPQLYQMLPSRE